MYEGFQGFRSSELHYISIEELHNATCAAVQGCALEVLKVCTDLQDFNLAGVHTCNSSYLNSYSNASIP